VLKAGDATQTARAFQQVVGDQHLQAVLSATQSRLQELESELQAARDRLTEHERRRPQRETVSEGYGEGVDHPGLEERLERLSEIQDRGKC
jgi:hypothetical protein